MRPNDYNRQNREDQEFSNDEFGRQAWDEFIRGEEEEEETGEAKDTGHIHLSRRAERDLLQFSNDKLSRRRSAGGQTIGIIAAVIGILLASVVGIGVMTARNTDPYPYEYDPEPYIEPYDDVYSYDIGIPAFDLEGTVYTLPFDLQTIIDQSNVHTDRDLYEMMGSEPVTLTLYNEYDEPIAELTVVSPDGSEVPVGKSKVVGLTIDDSYNFSWIYLPHNIAVQNYIYDLEQALRESDAEWVHTGSGSSSSYVITHTLEDGSTYKLTITLEDEFIQQIDMRIE